jgi:CubicO group peptidase (beta-lactamase class C family)
VLQELVQRWEGQPLEVLLREEILAPLGIHDIHLGLAEKDYPRMAKMTVGAEVRAIQARRSAMSDFINSYDGVRLPMASVMGVASALDLAKLMAVLAKGGTSNGHRVVSEHALAIASLPTNEPGYADLRLTHPIRWGLGFILGSTPEIYGSGDRPHLIGHAGGGANTAWADSKTGLAVAFLCNRMLEREQSWIRFRQIGDAIYAALG